MSSWSGSMSDWQSKKLVDVLELRRGFDLPSRLRRPGPYPVLSAGLTAGWHDEGPIKGPGFVVGRATNLGKPTWSGTDYWPLNTTLYVADFKGHHPRFLYHLFETLDLTGFDSGSVQPMLNRNYIANVEVRIPDLPTQRAIVEVLGALDDKIHANGRAITIARDLANARFSRVLAAHPGRRVALGELADCRAIEFGDGYRTKRSEHGATGARILRAGDVRGGRIFPDGPDFVADEYRARIGAKTSASGDIVLTTKGSVGRVAIVPAYMEEVVYSPQICYFRLLDESGLDSGYLAAWFNSRDLADQLAVVMHKSDMAPYVNLQDIRSLSIPLPGLSIQRAEGLFQHSMIDSLHALFRENDILERVRNELLPLLMSGR
ncbi:restriction endonuclease subunit S, partial [Micromonospora yasonensis]|uniref:restriction endonuclease subunit S n=1 Tax=Micromonospora yasonensis TaxID=1128667 RepID=UPI002231761D